MLCIKCQKEIQDDSTFCQFCGRKQIKESQKRKKKRGNGQGSVFKLPNGKYRAVVTLGYINGKRIQKTKSDFATKNDALAYIPILKMENPNKKEIRFCDLYDMWSKTHFLTIGSSKQQSYKKAYKRCEPLYFRKVNEIRLNEMQEIVDCTPGAYYPKHDIKVLLNNMFRYAKINEYCSTNYAEFIKLPPLEKPKKDAFTDEEIDAIWEDYNAGHDFTGYVLTMIYTGMRYGEISTILKENINLKDRYMIGGIKTDAGKNREIVIPEKIYGIIEKQLKNTADKKLMPISEKLFYKSFSEMILRTGIRHLTPHCCRHTYATLMARAGIQGSVIKELAGHTNYQTTLGYTHIPLKTKIAAANKI